MDRLTWDEYRAIVREEGAKFAVEELASSLLARWRKGGDGSLSESERCILVVESFINEMENGGSLQYLANDSGHFFEKLEFELAQVGLNDLRVLASEVGSICKIELLRTEGFKTWRDRVDVEGMRYLDVKFNSLYVDYERPKTWTKLSAAFIKRQKGEFFGVNA